MIEKKPFRAYTLDEDKKPQKYEVISLKLNIQERKELDYDKNIIKQTKNSTAIKQLAAIGSKVIRDEKMREILDIIFNNLRKNKRLGINEFEEV